MRGKMEIPVFTQTQIEKYADVLMWGLTTSRNSGFQKGDVILLQYDLAAVTLAEALFARIMDRGMHPVARMIPTFRMEHAFYAKADEGQLVFQVPGQATLNENLNGAIHVLAPESLTHLSDIDPKRIAMAAVARKPLRDILVGREEAGEFGWTLCMYPTPELAAKAGISVKHYADQIKKACFLKDPDPVARWRHLYAEAAEIKAWLNAIRPAHYHVESDNVDLRVTPGERRRWIGISGHNIPSFELFLSPDWRGVEGVYYADQPSYRSGNYVRGVRLEFREGEAVVSDAEEGAAFVAKQLAMDKGACRIGEFSLTDKRFSKIDSFMANTLFDENYGGAWGNCHIAVGSSYSDTYDGDPAELTLERKAELGFNDSALHWDLVNTEKKRVRAIMPDGSAVTVYEDGVFKN